jgi:hypothetical protein
MRMFACSRLYKCQSARRVTGIGYLKSFEGIANTIRRLRLAYKIASNFRDYKQKQPKTDPQSRLYNLQAVFAHKIASSKQANV